MTILIPPWSETDVASAEGAADPAGRSGAAPDGSDRWWRRPDRPAWSVPARVIVFGLTALLYSWDLSRVGMANTFYAAAVKSGTLSWKAFFFGSLDPGNFVTVDKPPAFLWVQELSGRIFGFSGLSMLVPEVIAGVVTVMVVYHLARLWCGEVVAVVASIAAAVTPVAVSMFRDNNPDAFLTVLLVLAAWALWSALRSARTLGLVLCGALVGLAFTTKTLEAFIVLPAFGLVYLWCGRPRLRRRIVQLAWAAVALVVSSTWWFVIVELWPASSRPYIGGSTDNSEWNLIFGYNGFSRIFGAGGPAGGGPGFAGTPGVLRMFNALLGGQISWLLPLALVGLVAGVWWTRTEPRHSLRRAGFVLWGGWTLTFGLVFSEAQGIFHPYYTVVMAPAVATLAAGGVLAMWKLGCASRWWAWVLPATIVGSAIWAAVLLARTPGYDQGLGAAVVVLGVLGAIGLLLALLRVWRTALGRLGALFGAAAVLAGPAAYALTTVADPSGGAMGSAGPGALTGGGPGSGPRTAARPGVGLPGGGLAAGNRGGVRIGGANAALVRYLEQHQGTAEYLVAVTGSQSAAPIIIESGRPVIAMGGFSGTDPAPSLAAFKHLVATGKVRYVLVAGQSAGSAAPGASGSPSTPGAGAGAGAGPLRFGPPPGEGPGGAPDGARPGSLGPGGGLPERFGAGTAGSGGALGNAAGSSGTARAGFASRQASDASAVDAWVEAHGTRVTWSTDSSQAGSSGALYLVTKAEARG
jgi:4-amino-4-deoxy-L-arabinose transferase-like glycosyltransferase